MVFFICEVCNEPIKKPKVEQHTHVCRNAWAFSCMDCGVRFEGPEYKAHTSCMSEAKRYEGKFYVEKEKKGERKQQSWMESVITRLESADPKHAGLKSYVEKLMQYDNLPRKKAKFVNFAKNSLNLKADREGIAEKLWGLIEDASTDTPPVAESEASDNATAAPSSAPLAESTPSAATSTQDKDTDNGGNGRGNGASDPVGDGEKKDKKKKASDPVGDEEKKDKKKKRKEKDKEREKDREKEKRTDKTDDEAKGDEERKEKDKYKSKDKVPREASEMSETSGKKRGRDDEISAAGLKPIKWKKIIAKELTSCGGTMNIKELRKSAVAEVLAHPSHGGRKRAELIEEFDREMPRFNRFEINGNRVTFAKDQTD